NSSGCSVPEGCGGSDCHETAADGIAKPMPRATSHVPRPYLRRELLSRSPIIGMSCIITDIIEHRCVYHQLPRGTLHVRGGSRGIGLCLICGRPLRTRIGDRRISTCARLRQAYTSSAQYGISTLPGRVLIGYGLCPTEPLLTLDKLCLKWYLSSRQSRVLTARFDGRLASHEAPAREQYFGQDLRLRLKFAWIRVTK